MVGVPGKAGACATCRRRKKGCDKQVPFCHQCISAGLVCEGYQQPAIWVNATGKQRAKYTRSHNTARTQPEPGSIVLYNSLVRSARDTKYIGLFLSAYLPNGRILSPSAGQLSPAAWLRYHEVLSRAEKSLQLITLAHGLSMLAHREGNTQLHAKSIEAYHAGLQETARAIQDPQRATGDGLLAAVRLYRFFEIRFGAESTGAAYSQPNNQVKSYYIHNQGEMALFTARGPHGHWAGPAKHLLADGRIVAYITNVGCRRRTFFSERDWMSIPWRNRKKTPLDVLTDTIIQIPSVLEDLDNLRAGYDASEQPYEAYQDLLHSCLDIEQSLTQWKSSMGDTFHMLDNALVQHESLPIVQTDEDIAVLHMCFLYWSACIILYTTMHFACIQPGLRENFASEEPPILFASLGSPRFTHPRNATLFAHKIAHAVPLCHQPHSGSYAVLASCFPLGLAVRFLFAAPYFPHEGGAQSTRDVETTFLKDFLDQPYMSSFAAKFLQNLHSEQKMGSVSGWEGAELRARRYWFGSRVDFASY